MARQPILVAVAAVLGAAGCAAPQAAAPASPARAPSVGVSSTAAPVGAHSCLVGQWTSTGIATQGPFDETGGAGIRLHIDAEGNLTTVFDGMAPVTFTASIEGQKVAGHFVYSGSDSAVLTLPPPAMTSANDIQVTNSDVSKLTASVQITSPISYSIGPISASSFGTADGAAGAVGSAPTFAHAWSCPDAATMTTSTSFTAGSLGSETGTWTFRRTGAR